MQIDTDSSINIIEQVWKLSFIVLIKIESQNTGLYKEFKTEVEISNEFQIEVTSGKTVSPISKIAPLPEF